MREPDELQAIAAQMIHNGHAADDVRAALHVTRRARRHGNHAFADLLPAWQRLAAAGGRTYAEVGRDVAAFLAWRANSHRRTS